VANKKKMIETYAHMPSLYNFGTDNEPYYRNGYKINNIAEFLNMNIATVRNWIKNGVIPETPILYPTGNSKIPYHRLYIWHQFEGLHLGILKYKKKGGFTNRNKHYMYNFVLEHWQTDPLLAQYERSAFVYKPLSRSVTNS